MRIVYKANSEQGRVFSYMRWSSEPQTWGDSERRQEQMAQDWCRRNGRTLAEQRFADRGVSGWKGDNRKSGALCALLKLVTPGDTILVEDSDRWSRETPLDSLNALRDTVNRGVDIVFLKTGVTVSRSNFNDPSVLIPSFFASFLANAENEKRAYRIRQAMGIRREQIEAGRAVPGSMPCWLKWDDEQDKPIVIEEKAKTVRRLFELSLSGMGVQSIVREMAGVPCISKSKKARWNNRFVYRLLTDKTVIGHYNRGKNHSVPGVFPPIVSEADFYASCAKIRARRNFTAPRKYQNSSLFTGLCKCAVCGGSLIKARTGHNGKYYDYLLCANGVRHDKGRCEVHAAGIRYDVFEMNFLGLLMQEAHVRAALTAEKAGPSHLDALKGELADVQKQSEKILKLIDGEDNPPKSLLARLKYAETREAELQAQIEAENAKSKSATPTLNSYEQLRKELPVPVLQIDRARVRELLRDLIDRIVIKLGEDEYAVHFKGGHAPFGVKIFAACVKG